MVAELSTLTLADLGRIVTGKTPPTSIAKNFGGDIPFITPSDMDGRRIIGETARYLTETGANSVKGARIPKGTIMVSCIGSDMGKTAIAAHDSVTNQQINSIIVDDRFCTKFVYYNLSTRKHEIRHQAAGGSAQPILNKSGFSKLPILLPPLPEQKAIARILGTLDDKIELNRRMNAALEAMARALFQNWFVDFAPVHAKAASASGLSDEALAKLGMDSATASLFSASFQDSAHGKIPKGWSIQPLSGLCSYLSRGIGPAYLETGGVLVLNQKCIRDHRVNRDHGRRHNDQQKSIKGRLVERFDILVNSTGVGTLGRVAQVLQLPEPTIVDSHVTIVRANAETDPHFLGVNLVGREAEIEGLGEGSTGQTELSRVRLGTLPFIRPPSEIQRAFGKLAHPIFAQIAANEVQSRTLATLRDTLLPKLLSGELSLAVPAGAASA